MMYFLQIDKKNLIEVYIGIIFKNICIKKGVIIYNCNFKKKIIDIMNFM